MSGQPTTTHIGITETLLRLYVFLAQHLDRSRDEATRGSFPEHDLQAHLSTTRSAIMDILSVNPVVKDKVQEECNRVLSLGTAYLEDETKTASALAELQQERAVLQNKTIALSDLLAVFKAMPR